MKTIFIILLAVSLGANVFLVRRYVWTPDEPAELRTFEQRVRIMADKLDLDDEQAEYFEQFLVRFKDFREQNAPQRDKYLAEIIKPEPDQRFLRDYHVGSEADKRRLAMMDMMRDFIEILRPEQRQLFIDMITHRSSSSSDPPKPSTE